MIVTFLRSSSMQSHEICPHQFYLTYVLGLRPPSGKSADRGTVVHKALEVMAHVSVCRRQGEPSYLDEAFGRVEVVRATPDWAIERAYHHYTSLSPHHEWLPADLRECRRLMRAALDFNGGQYDPRNLDVLALEQRFDFELEEDWARYDYTLEDGTRVVGQMGIKGTIDLIVRDRHDPAIIEIVDWKTGARKDWSKEGWAKKTYDEIRWDPQLCLYHYAATRLYPDIEDIFVTIFYIKDGGPYRLCFEPRDIEHTKEFLRGKFHEIRDTHVPVLKVGRKCTTFCFFGTHRSPHDPSRTICEFFKDKVRNDGIGRTTHDYGRPGAYGEYGDGGGRRDSGE